MSHQSKLHLFPIGVRLIYKSTYIINYSTVLSKEKSNVCMTATTLFDKIQHPHFTNNNKYLSKLGNMKLCSCCSINNLIKRIKTGQRETSSPFPGQWRVQLAQYSLLISSHIIPEASWGGTLHRHQYRPHLQLDHGLRHGPWQQLRLGDILALGGRTTIQVGMVLAAIKASGQTPSHSRTTNPNMVLSSYWVWMSPLPPAAVWPQDINLALDLKCLCGLWW